jgi:transcriptional regulator with XRE-family HTH domain
VWMATFPEKPRSPRPYRLIGARMRTLRQEAHITIEEMSRMLDVWERTYRRWEAGLSLPNMFQGLAIAITLNVPLEKFYPPEILAMILLHLKENRPLDLEMEAVLLPANGVKKKRRTMAC